MEKRGKQQGGWTITNTVGGGFKSVCRIGGVREKGETSKRLSADPMAKVKGIGR